MQAYREDLPEDASKIVMSEYESNFLPSIET